MNIVVSSCINFELQSNKKRERNRDVLTKIHIITDEYAFLFTSLFSLASFLYVFTQFSFIFTYEYKLALREFTRPTY